MSRRVRRKLTKNLKDKLPLPYFPDLVFNSNEVGDEFREEIAGVVHQTNNSLSLSPLTNTVDWSDLPDDTIIHLFSLLNHRDRANLAATCHLYRTLSAAPCLWTFLDLRANRVDASVTAALSRRCSALLKLRLRGAEAAEAVIYLRASSLREISGDYCRKISDATLSVIAARHENLETLSFGPDFCERISSDAIRAVGMCCTKLRKLRLSGIREIDFDSIDVIAKNCVNLIDLGFMDCLNVDETGISKICSLRCLSVAGTSNLKWDLVCDLWSKLPNLVCLDVSRTDIDPSEVSRLLSCCRSLRVLCVMNCSVLEEDESFVMRYGNDGCFSKGKLLVSLFSDVIKGVSSLFADNSMKGRNLFLDWRDSELKDEKLEEIMTWLEWILSHSLLRVAECNPPSLDSFWVSQGATLLLSLMQSSQEDVQERAATGLATFVVIDDQNASIDGQRAEAVMRGGGVKLLLRLASSCREGLQAESAKV